MRLWMSFLAVLGLGIVLLVQNPVLAQNPALVDNPHGLRNTPIAEEATPPRMANVENQDLRRKRSYPMQPPTIPHKIDNYQIDLNANRCMNCHSRKRTEDSQAPMISVTHYMDRNNNFLATVSPRRYFCEQCHLVQTDAKPLVENDFEDIDEIIARERKGQQ